MRPNEKSTGALLNTGLLYLRLAIIENSLRISKNILEFDDYAQAEFPITVLNTWGRIEPNILAKKLSRSPLKFAEVVGTSSEILKRFFEVERALGLLNQIFLNHFDSPEMIGEIEKIANGLAEAKVREAVQAFRDTELPGYPTATGFFCEAPPKDWLIQWITGR